MTMLHRVRVAFVALVAVTVLAVGVLEQAATWSPSPVTRLVAAASAAVAAIAVALGVRVLLAVDRTR